MELASIFGPWILLLLLALPLIYVEKLLHQHMYGVGYLLTKDQESATRFYYLLFFPGIFLHEFIQYLTAGLLNIKVKNIKMRPQKQNNGTLRFDFVTIDRRHTETWQAAVMGGVPFIIACVLVWTISNTILELTEVPAAFSTGDIRNIGEAFGSLRDTPDFWLWMYLLFAISNGMLPTKEDREGWYLILVGLGGLSVLFFVIGLQSVIIETLTGPVTESLNLVNTALFIILSIDIGVILMLGLVEDTIERITGEKMDYSGSGSKASSDGKRQPGSNVPIPKGELLPSVYNVTLPLPVLPKRGQMPVPRPTVTAPAADEEARPAGVPTPPRRETPAFARTDTQEVERVPDPDAAARAQMDPRVPRTSGDSPFRRSTLTGEEEEKQDEKPAAERKEATTSQGFGRRQPPDSKEEAKPASSRFGHGQEEAAEEKEAKPASGRFDRRQREEEKKDEAKTSPFARRTPDSKEEE
ncbi:MAG: hypothetical protein L0154_00465, partial [Chloroflexi bacterium]|nr:hypothetical protein [Chloroflexota bacterium]